MLAHRLSTLELDGDAEIECDVTKLSTGISRVAVLMSMSTFAKLLRLLNKG
jgi:hypothetical protein